MRTAFITGGSSGIGLALGEELIRRGYRVALASRRLAMLEEHVQRLSSDGKRAMALECDVTDSASVQRAVAAAVAGWGPIDLAVANAGVRGRNSASHFDLTSAEETMRTNFFGTLYLFAAVVPSMIERREGSFTGIASLAGLRGLPGSSMYSASKAAMQAFLEASRVELAAFDVSVTIVNPGYIQTAMTDRNRFPMPFLVPVDRAARIIANGIEKRRRLIEFPLPMSLMVRGLRALPAALFDRVTRSWAGR
ncbi:MAG TPA: SDR family NAD(P)-dependent oxidoreductase [Thermoanaerobaculia bacterium]|nr:SDR family NAD(P)-dependent oxidoreductase [Thermoanaerobaculia bacterium]